MSYHLSFLAEIPPEAALVLVFLGLLALGLGLKKKPKLTLAILVLSLAGWFILENQEMLSEQFTSFSQARMK